MFLDKYISKKFHPLDFDSSIDYNLVDFSIKNGANYIPVIKNNSFFGMIPVEYFYKSSKIPITTKELENKIDYFFLNDFQYILDSIKIFDSYPTNIIPILNLKTEYIGSITLQSTLNFINSLSFFSETGITLELEIDSNIYSSLDLVKIVESNNFKLLGILPSYSQNLKTKVIIKIIGNDFNSLTGDFERFGYSIIYKSFFNIKDSQKKERFSNLIKYLEI